MIQLSSVSWRLMVYLFMQFVCCVCCHDFVKLLLLNCFFFFKSHDNRYRGSSLQLWSLSCAVLKAWISKSCFADGFIVDKGCSLAFSFVTHLAAGSAHVLYLLQSWRILHKMSSLHFQNVLTQRCGWSFKRIARMWKHHSLSWVPCL